MRNTSERVSARYFTSMGGFIRALFGICLLQVAALAHADWNWKSALPWSWSSTKCTAGSAAGDAKQFSFGDTTASVACGTEGVDPWAVANAHASNLWEGGGGGGNAGGGGTYGSGTSALTSALLASSAIDITDISVSTTELRLTGSSFLSGGATSELGAFIFRGDPNTVFGSPGAEANTGILNIEQLLAAGVISPSDVIFRWVDGTIPLTMTDRSIPIPTSLQPDRQLLVVSAWSHGETAAIPEPSTWLVLATGLAGLMGYGWRQRGRVL